MPKFRGGPHNVAGGRLTLETGVPVSAADQSAVSTLRYTPFIGDQIGLYDAASQNWGLYTFTELSYNLANPTTAVNSYDVYLYDLSGVLTLQIVPWASATARTAPIPVRTNGVYLQTSALPRRLVGSIYVEATDVVSDTLAMRHVWNMDNRRPRAMQRLETSASWAYSAATIRQANGSVLNELSFMRGFDEDAVTASVFGIASHSANAHLAWIGIGEDSTTVFSAKATQHYIDQLALGIRYSQSSRYAGFPGVGRHRLTWLERGDGTATNTFHGVDGANFIQTGIHGLVWA